MSASGATYAVASKLGLAIIGVIGALTIAAVSPPQTKREIFWRALVAFIGSLVFGPACVRLIDHYTTWIDLQHADALSAIEQAAPIYFAAGGLSWFVFGLAASLAALIRDQGPQALVDAVKARLPK